MLKLVKGSGIGIGILAILLISIGTSLFAQESDSIQSRFSLAIEIRPRGEFRNNFQLTSEGFITPEFFVS